MYSTENIVIYILLFETNKQVIDVYLTFIFSLQEAKKIKGYYKSRVYQNTQTNSSCLLLNVWC